MQFIFPPIQQLLYSTGRVQRSSGKWKQAQHLYMKYKCLSSSQSTGWSLWIVPTFLTGSLPAHTSLHNCLHFCYYVIYRGKTQYPPCKHELCTFGYRNRVLKTRPGLNITSRSLQSIQQKYKTSFDHHNFKTLHGLISLWLPKATCSHQRPHLEPVKMLTFV